MRQEYPEGTPDAEEFCARHRNGLVDKTQPDHEHLATVYTVGTMCDRLERVFVDLIPNLPKWLKTGANSALANKVYDEVLRQCLSTCNETLKSMVAYLKVKADALGEEKMRHATWLGQAKTGVAMTKEQVDEIRHAIVKGMPHLEKKIKSETPPVAVAAKGSSGASSSGLQYRDVLMRTPSRNPPVRNLVAFEARGIQLPMAPHRGAMKRVFSDRGSDDPFAPTVQKHRDEQAKAAPSIGRNPNVDVRYRDRPAGAISSTLPRVVPAIGTPPGGWVPGRERDAAARAEAARAAAAALPYADDRRRNLPVAAAARARPIVAQELPRADSVAFIASRERSLPPRREPSRGPQGGPPSSSGELSVCFVFSRKDAGPSRGV